MRIAVFIFFDPEGFPFLLQLNGKIYVKGGIVFSQFLVVAVLDETAGIYRIVYCIHIGSNEFRVEVFQPEETTLAIYHRLSFAFIVNQQQRGDAGLFGDPVIVGPKSWRDMHDSCTVFRGNEITGDDTECLSEGSHPGEKLFIVYSNQLASCKFAK